jgi:hypothetical protein
MRIVSRIDEADVIERIRRDLGLWLAPLVQRPAADARV